MRYIDIPTVPKIRNVGLRHVQCLDCNKTVTVDHDDGPDEIEKLYCPYCGRK